MEQNVKDIIELLTNNLFIIEDFSKTKEDYHDKMETIYDYLKQGFEIKELRECPVYFKFRQQDTEIHKLQLRHFLTNLMFWEPIVKLDFEKLDSSCIVDCTKLSSKMIKSFIDNKIILKFNKKFSNRKLNKVISDMIYNLSRISTDFNVLLAMSMNIESFIDLSNRNEEFNEIIHTKLDENLQPNEIEDILDKLMKKQIKILREDPEGNVLQPILNAGSGIKDKQLSEFAINGGLKPDLDGNTIPIPINSNFVVGGLSNVTNYYIDALAGRKSVIMNSNVMGKAGHFSRSIMLLCSGIRLRDDEKACNSVNPVRFKIKTPEHLKRFIGRYYRLAHQRTYRVMTGDEKDLIGKEILVKSPITCSSKHGICKECYGELYHTNKDISIGAYAGTKITNPVSQKVLSSKHLLTTISEKIVFNDEFYNYFMLSANEVLLNTLNDEIDLNNYSLLIIKQNISSIEQFDEESDYNNFVTIVHVKNRKTGEIIEIMEKDGKELFISPELMSLISKQKNKDVYEIEFSKISDDMRLFVLEIENNELTRPLYNIMKLLNKMDHIGCTTIDEIAQKMIDLLIESQISATSVHGEVIINPLIRQTEDVLKRPKFNKYITEDDYQILPVAAALEKNPSVLVSFSFQELARQLTNPLTFRKSESSFIDPFYKELL